PIAYIGHVKRRPELTVLAQDGLSWLRMSPGRISKIRLHSLVRQEDHSSEPTPPAKRRAQVLSRMPLAAPARSAGSSWTRLSTAISLSPVRQCAVSFRSHPMTNKDRVATIN